MKPSHLLGAISACVFSLGLVTPANAASFTGRLETSPGSGIFQAYYDDQLNITWTADANINGLDTWDNQVAWAAGLDIDGVTGWRLASADVNGDSVIDGCVSGQAACKDNEYYHLFSYGANTTLGNGISIVNPGPFSNVSGFYWSGTELDSSTAWLLGFHGGGTGGRDKSTLYSAWAVRSGDVGAVPIPAAAWLFGTGLLGLIGMARRKKT